MLIVFCYIRTRSHSPKYSFHASVDCVCVASTRSQSPKYSCDEIVDRSRRSIARSHSPKLSFDVIGDRPSTVLIPLLIASALSVLVLTRLSPVLITLIFVRGTISRRHIAYSHSPKYNFDVIVDCCGYIRTYYHSPTYSFDGIVDRL